MKCNPNGGSPHQQPNLQAPHKGLSGRTATRNDVLTNSDIVGMQKAGIPEDVVLAKIRKSSTDFYISPQNFDPTQSGRSKRRGDYDDRAEIRPALNSRNSARAA
jgi:hypothetical protein